MNIYKVLGATSREKVAEAASYAAARAYLAKLGQVIVFDLDTFAGGADALVVPHGSRFADQYDIGI